MFSLKHTTLVQGTMINAGAVFENVVLRTIPEFENVTSTHEIENSVQKES